MPSRVYQLSSETIAITLQQIDSIVPQCGFGVVHTLLLHCLKDGCQFAISTE